MTLHDDALTVLTTWAAPSAEAEATRQRFLDLVRPDPATMWREHPGAHVTASALVVDAAAERVLLCLHGRIKRWVQLGGHCEPGDVTIAGAALREATEESGLARLTLDPVPVQLSEHAVPFCGPHGDVRHLDVRFLAVAPGEGSPAVSDESLDVRWWPADALPEPEADLVELVALARARRQSSPPSSRAPAE